MPAILAVVTIAKNPRQWVRAPPTYPYRYETRMITNQTELRPLAKKLKVSYGALLEMNPDFSAGNPSRQARAARSCPLVVKPDDPGDDQNNN